MSFVLKASPPSVFIGVQSQFRLNSRLKHAGMTDFEWAIELTQQAAGNQMLNASKRRARIIVDCGRCGTGGGEAAELTVAGLESRV